ncbi:MAG: RNA-binding protein [Halieaceae bacterium]|jgi:RNA-binding protein
MNQQTTETKALKSRGHKLKPLVTVAAKGLSDTVLGEIDRALADHELIKVKIKVGDRASREQIAQDICKRTKATIIQQVGGVILVLRRADKPNPRLSNLIRIL